LLAADLLFDAPFTPYKDELKTSCTANKKQGTDRLKIKAMLLHSKSNAFEG
jgi:hypothetical protein